jgi:hypothetical protein
MDASGRTGADSSRLHWTAALDGWTPDGWTPDGLDTGRTGHQRGWTLDGWTVGPGRRNRCVDTTWWTRTGDRRHGRRPGLVDHGGNARPLDGGWTLRRAVAVWATNQPGQLGSRTTGTGPATAAIVSCRCYSAVQLAPRRTAVLGRLRVERRARRWPSSVMQEEVGRMVSLLAAEDWIGLGVKR